MASTAAGKQRIPKVAKVKNKAPAEVQITAEQLLREAKERELELLPPPPKQKITDEEELNDYKLKKRKQLDKVRAMGGESQGNPESSLHLRACPGRRPPKHRPVAEICRDGNEEPNHAAIWDRAITILPLRSTSSWYKYSYMEEMLGNVAGCRQVFERWMEWEPEEQAWHSFINFELRYKEVEKARSIYERYIFFT
ncbi:hypothetical protein GJAV_G00121160 [Gymnothorax javanicus]|nr:hypothetical protein GJAV_G00121160 [Gymnothorax javanicus]